MKLMVYGLTIMSLSTIYSIQRVRSLKQLSVKRIISLISFHDVTAAITMQDIHKLPCEVKRLFARLEKEQKRQMKQQLDVENIAIPYHIQDYVQSWQCNVERFAKTYQKSKNKKRQFIQERTRARDLKYALIWNHQEEDRY